MTRVKIRIIQLGASKHTDEWSFIKKLRRKGQSKLFEITKIDVISLSQSDHWGYSDSSLLELISRKISEESDYTLCFIDYPLQSNFFVRRLSKNVGVATFYETSNIFSESNIELKNFILLQIYKIVILSKLDIGNGMEEILQHYHDETRGCLFDMCGLKEDIVISATNPKICHDCESKLRKTLLDLDFFDTLTKELKQIKKTIYFRMTDWIKKHPFLALFIAISSSLIINILSAFIYDAIRGFLTCYP